MIIKPYLIAEIGINHNGDVKIAKDLIDQSKKANFDCVKFQKRDIQTVYSQDILESFRESPWGNTQRKQKEGLEFGESEYDIIDQYCKKVVKPTEEELQLHKDYLKSSLKKNFF